MREKGKSAAQIESISGNDEEWTCQMGKKMSIGNTDWTLLNTDKGCL